jgi:hypothetical protein
VEKDVKKALSENPDYICLPRYGCSLKRVLERYPDGVPTTAMAAKALDVSEEEFDSLVAVAITKLKALF